jgi:hypothetical protein
MEAPGQVDTIVVIASPTRGFVLPPPDMPPVTSPYPARPQDQDEKGSVTNALALGHPRQQIA